MTAQEFSTRVLEVEGMLYRVAYGILLNQSDCADAVQETLMRSWEKLHTLREEEYFRTWLTRILINQCYSMIRKRRFFLPLDSARTVAAPQGADIALHDAIARLDNKLRLPLVLHYMEGYSIEEIAQMLSQPSGTIKTRLMRGRKLLRAALSDEDTSAASRLSDIAPSDNVSQYAAPVRSLSVHLCMTSCTGAVTLRTPNPIDLLILNFHDRLRKLLIQISDPNFDEGRKSRHE